MLLGMAETRIASRTRTQVERNAAPLQPEVEQEPESINHPAHYNMHPSGVEAIDILEHFTFNVGSSIKYAWRAGLKLHGTPKVHEDPYEARLRDLKKAVWYLDREIDRLVKDREEGRA